MAKITGRVRKFGDNIDTDNITPSAYLHLPIAELVKYAFSPLMPGFYETVRTGDIILAGCNYGCGSSREMATEIIKVMGIKYNVCQSMARIYFRNCIATGVYPIISKDAISILNEGDEIEIDIEQNVIINVCSGKTAAFEPIPQAIKPILEAGGILELLKRKLSNLQTG
jgi:3-isopropylmalate/(R)-2-methylmalate dehydratase small subunit